ncbi:16S rRNA (guanine(527)-N(7))-methyltransferase RsmG [Dehalogenimonas alkenigignens]|uniref:Ribosomal RNA small subunit methyltransferase G n=1 Tax=Dehalogenimonas alkenigignens TaxID=1217799 RepID=A0A0W0GIQ2_9CHLR|nr:16S rRNA (guanine(527)-N(7))-methyltransferase RsmG [Dehalogenimonas alkenigignens]KTB48459.1 16S rRNA m(7)G-527 methyltransferase [Dehalogenimonas alkenigignens]
MNLSILKQGASRLGIELSEGQLEQFERYFQLLAEWNSRINLTSVIEYEAVQSIHFLDSLSIAAAGISLNGRRVIDVGTGAGFPGVPLKIAFPEIELTLLEATGKKAAFLTETAAQLQLKNVAIINARAEDAACQPEHRERYDLVVARALAPLNVLCELCLPFCALNGRFVAWKKGDITAETDAAGLALRILGGDLRQIVEIDAQILGGERKLIVAAKSSLTPPEYPRRSGLPAKKPLC